MGKQVVPVLARLLLEIPQELVANLTLGLVDERFGLPRHGDSNMLVIKKSGLVEIIARNGGVVAWPLNADLLTIETTVKAYNSQITRLFNSCKGRILGVFGIGADGHTAGIKPLAEISYKQLFVSSPALVVGYRAEDYERITLTPVGISKITTAVIYATGEQKQAVLEKLVGQTEFNEHEFPSGVFKQHQNVHVFTDKLV